jgi:hypothetical protein
MANISALRLTKDTQSSGEISYAVKASTIIYAGGIVEILSGVAKPATKGSGKKYVGVAKKTVDNSAGADGDLSVVVQRALTQNGERLFAFDNDVDAGALAAGDVGASVYLIDDHTVSKTSTGATALGEMVRLAEAQVWVLLY